MSTWMIYREDKQTGIRFFLGRIEAQEPLAALRLAAQLYECDPNELVVRTFLPEAACNPLMPWLLFLDLFVEGTSAYDTPSHDTGQGWSVDVTEKEKGENHTYS